MTTAAAYRPTYVEDGPFPGAEWEERTPEAAGLRRERLDALAAHVRGRGVVVRGGRLAYGWGDTAQSGDIASARKPIVSTLLALAVQDGLIESVDEPLSKWEPRLAALNGGKDAGITWRHLGSQTSGYGWSEAPGEAWSYNDYALALYVDTLFEKVYREDPTAVLQRRLAQPLGFQDPAGFNAETQPGVRRRGRIAVSVRDHARFGLLCLRRGRWRDAQVVRPDLMDTLLSSVVPAETPATAGVDTPMLEGQVTHGGGKRTNAHGPGQYSFNWWLNLEDREGRPLFPDLPRDAYVAIGLGLTRGLFVVPSWDVIVAWQDASWSSDDKVNPGKLSSVHNVAARLMAEAVG